MAELTIPNSNITYREVFNDLISRASKHSMFKSFELQLLLPITRAFMAKEPVFRFHKYSVNLRQIIRNSGL